MKVLFDVTAVSAPLSGIGRYALELARHLPQIQGISEVHYLRGDRVGASFDPTILPAARVGNGLRARLKPLLPYRLVLGPYRRHRARALAARLHSYRDHLFYSPNFSVPPVAAPTVATLHDLSVFHFPQFHPRDRVNYLRDQIHHSVRQAGALVTDSAYVRDELIALFDLPPTRVHAIPLGVDAAFRELGREALTAVLGRYRLQPGGYLLSVGTLEPRKNLPGLLAAYQRLAPALRRRYPLVIAGPYGWRSAGLVEEIERRRSRGELIYLDYVPESDLPALYAGAAVFAYFSFYEGFGLPVLEAMASGVPVVCSGTSALPELCAGGALQADPHDSGAMASALQRALEDEHWRRGAVAWGLERSAGYTWAGTAEALAGVFRGLAG